MARARKNGFKDLLLAVITLSLVLSAFSAVKTFFSKETKNISSFSFSLGKLNADGTYSESKTSVCSDYISCNGFKITFDKERKADYWVFYYDADKKYIGNTGKLSSDYEVSKFDTTAYIRVFIAPELKDGQEKIRSWEVFAYANVLDISVKK